MKRLITSFMILLFLTGCSGRKTDTTDQPKPEIEETPVITPTGLETYYGTWRTAGLIYQDVRFTMEQIKLLGSEDELDVIIVIDQDGTAFMYSADQEDLYEGNWEPSDDQKTISLDGIEIYIENDELILTVDEDTKLCMEKISESQDQNIISDLTGKILNKPESQEIKEPEPKTEEKEETITEDTIRPEIKEAIDAYEAFIDEYCEFMKKYAESDGNDLSILSDYMKFMGKLEEYSSKMEDMEDDLTDAEFWYYYEVLNRCNEKMLKASY